MEKLLHSKNSVLRGFLCVGGGISLLALIIPGNAAAQSSRDDMHQKFLDVVEDKQQYEADEREKDRKLLLELERIRAEAASKGIDTGTRQSSGIGSASSASQNYDVPRGDALAGTNAATYRLTNGVILRVSGDFWPDPPGVCVANCE